MQIKTRYFGDLTYTEKEVLHIEHGLFGFEKQTQYILVRFEEDNDSMVCLQSIENEELAFIMMNPFYLLNDYSPTFSEEELLALNLQKDDKVLYYVLCVVKEVLAESTVNLKCPFVINARNNLACQLILDDSDYTFKHKLTDFIKKET